MAANCPICGVEVDVRRAPAARVIGGAVVSFCSTACADRAQPRPPKVTAPIQNADIVEEVEAPKQARARTEPPRPPPGSGDPS